MEGPQDLLVDNVCGFNNFCFVPQQQEVMQFDLFQNLSHQKQQNHQQGMDFSRSILANLEKQRIEIDQFIVLQNERLRVSLQQQRKHQLTLLSKNLEAKGEFLLKQKEEEIIKAVNRTTELEEHLKKMEIENQTWQRLAREKEIMIASLNQRIEELKESVECVSDNLVDDGESCCGDQEEEKIGNIRKIMVCWCCKSQNSCVIMLPCRHMCSCKDCEALLYSCPVCGIIKRASIEALFN